MSIKVRIVRAMVFPGVMYGCESWTIKKAEHRRIDAFELWCWRRLLRVPWTAGRSNQTILKEISPEYSLEGLMLKLKLQYFGHLMGRADSLEKTLMLGKIEGRRRRGPQRVRWLDGVQWTPTQWTWVWVNSRSWWWTGRPGVLWFMGSQRVRHDQVTELNWTKLEKVKKYSTRGIFKSKEMKIMARIRKEITGENAIHESLLDFERNLIREELIVLICRIMALICRTILVRTLGIVIHLNV